MLITITSGVGSAQTKLAAFDAALWDAGIANFNLLVLSSMIPPGSEIIVEKSKLQDNTSSHGNRLYVVLAKSVEVEFGREAWAGIGWTQASDGRGLFVEHAGATEDETLKLIDESLLDMTSYRKDDFGEKRTALAGLACIDRPVCAIVAAVFDEQPW